MPIPGMPIPGMPIPGAPLPAPATAARTDRGRLLLSADEATNTLFATGDAGLIDKVAGLVEKLDVMRVASHARGPDPQPERQRRHSTSASSSAGIRYEGHDWSASLRSSAWVRPIRPGTPGAPRACPASRASCSIQATSACCVNALQVLNKGRALNIPKVLVNSNQRANLASVLQTPFLSTNVANVDRHDHVRRHAGRRHHDRRPAPDRRGRPPRPGVLPSS